MQERTPGTETPREEGTHRYQSDSSMANVMLRVTRSIANRNEINSAAVHVICHIGP